MTKWQPQRVHVQRKAIPSRQLFAAAVLLLIFALSAILGPSLDSADKVEVKNMVGAAKYMAAREGR